MKLSKALRIYLKGLLEEGKDDFLNNDQKFESYLPTTYSKRSHFFPLK